MDPSRKWLYYLNILLAIIYVKGECPDEWLLKSGSSFCYRAFEGRENEVSWTAAESICNSFGADLVSFESENEQNWVYNILTWNQSSSSWRYYWIGLNDLNNFYQLEWVSTTSYKPEYKYSNFGTDANVQHDSQRCTFALFSNNLPGDYGHEGKWYKEKCEKTKGTNFICKLDESNFIRKCDQGWDLVKWGTDQVS